MNPDITFVRLSEISIDDLIQHMSDQRVAKHMPLLSSDIIWNLKTAEDFIAMKEQYWEKDGLGHWAFLSDGNYVGWGGFQKENQEWDFGLVLKPDHFGMGMCITKKAINFAKDNKNIPFMTFLLPPSRTNLKGLNRLGATYLGKVDYEGTAFLKYRLETQ